MAKENRAAARLNAVQALYQMEIASKGLHWIGGEIEGEQYHDADIDFFRNVLKGVLERQVEIDRMTDHALNEGWPLRRIEAVMRAVLRAAVFELIKRRDVPARVVVKEYVDVAAAFLARDEVGMINAVLDRLARETRAEEFDPK